MGSLKATAKSLMVKFGIKDELIKIKNTFIDGYDEDGETNNDSPIVKSLPWNSKLPNSCNATDCEQMEDLQAAETVTMTPDCTPVYHGRGPIPTDTTVAPVGMGVAGEMSAYSPFSMMPGMEPLATDMIPGDPSAVPMAMMPVLWPSVAAPWPRQAQGQAQATPAPSMKQAGCVPPMEEKNGWTTLILRNIPNNYMRQDLLDLLDEWRISYDFVYAPMDFQRKANRGYAFMNVTSPSEAERVMQSLEGFSDWSRSAGSKKHLKVGWAVEEQQGLFANIRRYQDSPVMHDEVPDQFKPVIFNNGQRMMFPPPTMPLQRPGGLRY